MDGAYQRDDVGIVPYDFCIDSRNIWGRLN